MKIGPKYKICKRLGAGVFEKCQTKRYTLAEARFSQRKRKRRSPRSDFGLQHIEKQKMRFTYGLSERQFARYVKESTTKKGGNAVVRLFQAVESRLDNIVYRGGFASTRAFARQLVAHGHITVNGKRVTIPSYHVAPEDVVGIRIGSMGKPVFAVLDERFKELNPPPWLNRNAAQRTLIMSTSPAVEPAEAAFDSSAIIGFYSR